MEESYTLGMSLMDFLPPSAFLMGAIFLVKFSRKNQNQLSVWLLTIGGILTFLGGFFQASWKLLMALQIANIGMLSDQQFVLMAPGFLCMFFGVMSIVRTDSSPPQLSVIAAWKIPFLIVMTLSSIGMEGILTYHAFRKGVRLAGWMFIFAVLCLFAMAGMASSEQTVTLQWVEQSINLIGQSAFALGSYLLYRKTPTIKANNTT